MIHLLKIKTIESAHNNYTKCQQALLSVLHTWAWGPGNDTVSVSLVGDWVFEVISYLKQLGGSIHSAITTMFYGEPQSHPNGCEYYSLLWFNTQNIHIHVFLVRLVLPHSLSPWEVDFKSRPASKLQSILWRMAWLLPSTIQYSLEGLACETQLRFSPTPANVLPSFPGLSHLQSLIVCNVQICRRRRPGRFGDVGRQRVDTWGSVPNK